MSRVGKLGSHMTLLSRRGYDIRLIKVEITDPRDRHAWFITKPDAVRGRLFLISFEELSLEMGKQRTMDLWPDSSCTEMHSVKAVWLGGDSE